MARKLGPAIPPARRFWSHVQFAGPDDCWLWTGTRHSQGYGEFTVANYGSPTGRLRATAHRCAWRYTFGEITDGLQVNHHCDVRLCVNPRHLYLGTQRENMDDMVRRGRSAGRKRRIFTPEQVRAIRSSATRGAELGRQLGVDQSTISLIRSRRTYADVE